MDPKAIAHRAIELGAMQKQDELEDLLEILVEHPPRRVLEVGCFMGGTLFAWRQLGADVVAIDQVVHERFRGHGARLIVADSHNPGTFFEVQQLIDDVDLLFIDGDHTLEGVVQDFDWYSSLVRPRGLVALHDICVSADPNVEVWKFWRQLRSAGTRELVRAPKTWGGIGLLVH